MTKSASKDYSWLVLIILAIPVLWLQSGGLALEFNTTLLGGLGLTLLFALGAVAICGILIYLPDIISILFGIFVAILFPIFLGFSFVYNEIVKKPASNGNSG